MIQVRHSISRRVIDSQQLATSRGPVEFIDVGVGPPVLYFHGTGAGFDAVLALEQPLIEQGFRLIVPHRPGYYGTGLVHGGSPDECADLALAVLDHLEIENAVVVGTSGGGLGACRFVTRHRSRGAGLVLQCALTHPFTSSRWMPRRFRWLYALLRRRRLGLPLFRLGYRLEMLWLRIGPKHLISHMAGTRMPELRNDDAMLALLPAMIEATLRCAEQPMGIENDCINSFGDPWLAPGTVKCPTMVIHDLADPVVGLAHVDWAMQCIGHAELCDLHLGGHLIWLGKDRLKMQSRRAEFIRRVMGNAQSLD